MNAETQEEEFMMKGSVLSLYDGNAAEVAIPEGVTEIEKFAFGYSSSLTVVAIPEGVTRIGHSAFWDCSNLMKIEVAEGNPSYTSVDGILYNKAKTKLVCYPAGKQGSMVIPESVTSIGRCSFRGSGLTDVTIPESVTCIGRNAFQLCSSLTSITIPEGVTGIGRGAFSGCSSLTKIEVAEGNPSYTSVDGLLYNKDKTELVCCPGGKQGSIIIQEGVTSIGEVAFEGCGSVTSVTIPEGVTDIHYYAFAYCSSLARIMMPESVTFIEKDYFEGGPFAACEQLTIYAPAGSYAQEYAEKEFIPFQAKGNNIEYRNISFRKNSD